MGRRKSIIWEISLEEFTLVVGSSSSYKEVLNRLGLEAHTGGNYKTLKKRICEDDVDASHIEAAKRKFRGTPNQRPLESILKKGTCSHSSSRLKRRLVRAGMLQDKCASCGIGCVWNGKPITLQLDHINGDRDDNRIDNLRVLCPNCHSQTKTFGGRNCKSPIRCKCGAEKSRGSRLCIACYKRPEKAKWPADAVLEKMVRQSNKASVARELGVSETAVRKRITTRHLKC